MYKYFLFSIIGYFIGSLPFSYLTGKYLGKIDIREYGSGNTGSTNVLRTLGKKAGLVAFLGDFLKGFIVAIISKRFGIELAIVTSGFAVIGHCFPIWLKFKGGKGVATSGGTIFGLYPLVGFILLFTIILIIAIFRIVSLASITVAFLFPIISIIFNLPKPFIIYSFLIGAFVIYKHKSNIKRLLNGKESKIKFSK